MPARTLVAGIGNIFLRDDGFGPEVARRLAELDLPGWVTVGDYGSSGMHLAYDLADGYDLAILVDTAPRGGTPGTVYVIEPEQRPATLAAAGALAVPAFFDAHGMQPDVVLAAADMLGAKVARMLIVGCEPRSAEYGIGLSEPVAAAVEDAVKVVLDLITQLSGELERGEAK